MERDIAILFQKTLKAAEAAEANDGGSNESRCIELLKSLKDFPLTVDVLASTQIDKRLRHLKKHPREKIRLMAAWLMEVWSKKIKHDRSLSRNKGGEADLDDLLLFASSCHQSSLNERKLETSSRKRFCLAREDKKAFSGFRKPLQQRPRVSKESDATTTVPFKKPLQERPRVSQESDASRNKVREILLEAFSRVSSEVSSHSEEVEERVRGCDPVGVAGSVESVMFEKMGSFNGPKKLKYRSIMFNVRDPKNPDLRRKILLGDIKPERLIGMTSEEMASHHMQCKNDQLKRKVLSGLIMQPAGDSVDRSDGDEVVRIESLW